MIVAAASLCLVLAGCGNVKDGFYRLRGDAFKSDGDPEEAIRWYSRISSNNCTVIVLNNMAECYEQLDDYKELNRIYRELYSRTKDTAYMKVVLFVAEQEEDYSDGIQAANELLKYEPENWKYRSSLIRSMLYSQQSNQVPGKLEEFENEGIPTLTNRAILGTLWYEYGDITNAIRLMKTAVDLAPSNTLLRMRFAWFLAEDERYVPAVSNLQAVVRQEQDIIAAHQLLGAALAEMDRTREAEMHLRHVIKLDQLNATALNDLAYLLLLENRNVKEALELALSAVQIQRDGPVLDTLAFAYYRRGKYDIALRYLQEAEQRMYEEHMPGDPELDYHFGLVYAELGEIKKALPRFRAAIEKEPELKELLQKEHYYPVIEKEL
jgi:tetratricopeptide (TPR) repeat protein